MPDPLLSLTSVRVEHDGIPAVHGVDLDVSKGELVGLVGANGAGKTSLLRSIAGDLRPAAGAIVFADQETTGMAAHSIVDLGLSHVPEGRRLFGPLSVEENLRLGAYTKRASRDHRGRRDRVLQLFPLLSERLSNRAETLSGGEQQMLSIARGLMSDPSLLMIDELSLGVMPTIVAQLYELLEELRSSGIALLVADQNVSRLLESADRAYVMQTGRIVVQGTGSELLDSEEIKQAYLGS